MAIAVALLPRAQVASFANALDATMLLNPSESVLIVIDVQQRLWPAMADPKALLRSIELVLSAALRLGIPVLATEHCPEKIGRLIPEIGDRVPADAVVTKSHFNAVREPEFLACLRRVGRSRPVLVGTEAHVCVLQTALGLAASGYGTTVVSDATACRRTESHAAAMRRLAAEGVELVTAEMAVFEWLERGGTPEFRDLLPAVKAT
jgi:nicotinamidase-related amidase